MLRLAWHGVGRHLLISLFVIICLPLLTSCGPPLAEAYVTFDGNHYYLKAMPCKNAELTGAYVYQLDDKTGAKTSLWETEATGANSSSEIMLFQTNDGFTDSGKAIEIYDKEVKVAFSMSGYAGLDNAVTGKLNDIKEGQALTTDGIISETQISNWWCG